MGPSAERGQREKSRPVSGQSLSHKARSTKVQTTRSEILKAAQTATETLGQCPNRLWAVTRNLPGGLENLPQLFPPERQFCAFPRTKIDHHQCSFEFCEHSQLDFTSVSQRHECDSRLHECEQLGEHFPSRLLDDAAEQGLCMAWKFGGKSLATVPQGYMAISHVWSDGTGSGAWPEKGVNRCLWFFFMKIAKQLQVSGIWWDTISLPRSRAARSAAISRMHQNYEDARVTLVHDCFLRNFEWDENRPRNAAEMGSLAIIMSPWFSRGWTALELAMSVKVKLLFKKGDGYVIKDLDNDILAVSEDQSSIYHIATGVIKNLRKRRVTRLDDLLTVLGPRYTSWSRDMAVIAGLLTGVKSDVTSSQSEIYQNILRRIGKVSHRHLYYNAPKMSKGFTWCPANLLNMPLASCNATLCVEENGNLAGFWKAFRVDNISLGALAWIGIPPLTEVALRSALDVPKQHVFLVEPATTSLSGALLVEVLGRHKILRRLFCKLVGFLPFHPVQSFSVVNAISLEASLGDTDMTEENGTKDAWSTARSCRHLSQKSTLPHTEDSPDPEKTHIVHSLCAGGSVDTSETRGNRLLTHAKQKISLPCTITSGDELTAMEVTDVDIRDNYERTPLHCAIWRNHEQTVGVLIGQGADRHIKDELGHQPLHLAAERGNLSIIKTLINSETDCKATCDFDGQIAFHRGALSGSIPVIELLKSKSPVHALDRSGQTALHIATFHSYLDMAKLLLEWGIGSNVRDKHGRTALWWAARNGNEHIVDLLLQQSSIEASTMDEQGRTALHMAARYAHTQVVRSLIKHSQANVGIVDIFGRTPIFHATLYDRTNAVQILSEFTYCSVEQAYWQQESQHIARSDLRAAIDFLLENRSATWKASDIGERMYPDGPGNENLVVWAASMGFFEIVEYLLEIGMYPDTKTRSSLLHETPLQRAAQNGDEHTLQMLLGTGEVNINYQEGFARTALCDAVISGNPVALDVLLKSDNIDLNVLDFDGESALQIAAEVENPAIIARLLATRRFDVNYQSSPYTGRTALARAAIKGYEEVVKLLLSEEGIKLDLVSVGQTPLQLAAENGHAEVARLLLETGDVNINVQGMLSKTPLMFAAEPGHHSVVSLLLDSGKADATIKNWVNETALSLAVKKGHDEVIKVLLLHLQKIKFQNQSEGLEITLFECARLGLAIVRELLDIDGNLDVNARNDDMQTPLMRATVFGKIDFIRELLTCGKPINVNAQDKYLKTSLAYAAERGNEVVVTELLALGDKVDVNLEDVVGCTALFHATIRDHIGVANRLWSTGRAKFGSAELPMQMHIFDPMLRYIDNVKISDHYGCSMPDGVAGDLQQMKTNVRVPLSTLAKELRRPGAPDPRDTLLLAKDNHVFDALLDHIDRKRRSEHRQHEISSIRRQVIDSIKEIESVVDHAPHLFIPEPPEYPESDQQMEEEVSQNSSLS